MNKGGQVIGKFWDVLNKMMWLDKYKMKDSLRDYKPSEVHCIEKEFQERDRVAFEQMTEEDYNIMLCFAEKYGAHLDEEIKKLCFFTRRIC